MAVEPTLTVTELGTRRWRVNGQYHRTDGPAVEWMDGDRWWYLNGQRHRADGPAIEWASGYRAWYFNGQLYTFQEWLDAMDFDEHTRLLMTLKYGS